MLAETPESLIKYLISLDTDVVARSQVELSGLIERAKAAQASLSPGRTTVERLGDLLDEIGLRIAVWCPHGFDSARASDYQMANEIHARLDDARAVLGLERLHGKVGDGG